MANPSNKWQVMTATLNRIEAFDRSRSNPSGVRLYYSYTVDGQRYTEMYRDYCGNSPREYQEGSQLEIEYQTAHPEKSRVPAARSFFQWVAPIWGFSGLAAAILLGIKIYLDHRR